MLVLSILTNLLVVLMIFSIIYDDWVGELLRVNRPSSGLTAGSAFLTGFCHSLSSHSFNCGSNLPTLDPSGVFAVTPDFVQMRFRKALKG